MDQMERNLHSRWLDARKILRISISGGRQVEVALAEKIGEGSAGVVYRASACCGGFPDIAIKILRPRHLGTPVAERFAREAELLCRLSHPGLVRGIACGTMPPGFLANFPPFQQEYGTGSAAADPAKAGPAPTPAAVPYLAMEFVDGRTLASMMTERGESPMPADEAMQIALGVAGALGYLHLDGRVLAHRDVKPENIMVAADGSPKLMDLGVAKTHVVMHSELETRTAGTLHYMAPEQIADSSRADVRADIYSTGIVLLEMLGKSWPADERRLLACRLAGVPQSIDEDMRSQLAESGLADSCIDALDGIVAKACAFNPGARYQTPQAMASDIRALECRLVDMEEAGGRRDRKRSDARKVHVPRSKRRDARKAHGAQKKRCMPRDPNGSSRRTSAKAAAVAIFLGLAVLGFVAFAAFSALPELSSRHELETEPGSGPSSSQPNNGARQSPPAGSEIVVPRSSTDR